VDDDVVITVTKRIRLGSHKIWREHSLEEGDREYVALQDSICQEEYRRFIDLKIIDKEGYITKLYPLGRVIIRPRTSC